MCNYPTVKYFKEDKNAVSLKHAHPNDTGLDLSMIKFSSKENTDNMVYLDSGIVLQPNHDHYFEVVPRSSFAKKCPGWVMVNSPGIIDTDYRGTVQICLQKFDPKRDVREFKFPLNAFQLVHRKIEPYNLEIIQTFDELSKTKRSSGGFGSTDAIFLN